MVHQHKHDFLNQSGNADGETIKNESECHMRKARRESSGWPVCLGIFMAYVGIALIGFGGWYSLEPSLRWLIYLAGLIVFLAGLFLLWKDLLNAPACLGQPISPRDGHFLGEFELNGHFFKAYELETAQDGR